MRTTHRNPHPTAPRPRAHPPGWPPSWAVVRATRTTAAALALAPLLTASCTDDVAASCPPLAHPEVLTVAAATGNPCAARWGESGAVLALQGPVLAEGGR
jgi:hypothetical protein